RAAASACRLAHRSKRPETHCVLGPAMEIAHESFQSKRRRGVGVMLCSSECLRNRNPVCSKQDANRIAREFLAHLHIFSARRHRSCTNPSGYRETLEKPASVARKPNACFTKCTRSQHV